RPVKRMRDFAMQICRASDCPKCAKWSSSDPRIFSNRSYKNICLTATFYKPINFQNILKPRNQTRKSYLPEYRRARLLPFDRLPASRVGTLVSLLPGQQINWLVICKWPPRQPDLSW